MALLDPSLHELESHLLNGSLTHASQGPVLWYRAGEHSVLTEPPNPLFHAYRTRIHDVIGEKNQTIAELTRQLGEERLERSRLHYLRAQEVEETNRSTHDMQCQLTQIRSVLDREPYLKVLIDGEHFMFHRHLMQDGEPGGQKACRRLQRLVARVLVKAIPGQQVPRVVVKIFADFRRMAEVLTSAGVLDQAQLFTDFIRGFNRTDALYDYIDTGSMENGARMKINECLHLDIPNAHCWHIILGICESDSYRDFRLKLLTNLVPHKRFTMLGHRDPSSGSLWGPHKGPQFRFGAIFTGVTLNLLSSIQSTPPVATRTLSPVGHRESLGVNDDHIATGFAAGIQQTSPMDNSVPPPVSGTQQAYIEPTSPSVRLGILTPPSENLILGDAIERNRSGQRIDRQDTTISRYELARVASMNLCRLYYLRDPPFCPFASCDYRHDHPITDVERRALRANARNVPCFREAQCNDPKCIYGHHCPYDESLDDECTFFDVCRFGSWGHGIDREVV